MSARHIFGRVSWLGWILGLHLIAIDATAAQDRELIQDNRSVVALCFGKTKPGKHVRYGALEGLQPEAKPVWGIITMEQ